MIAVDDLLPLVPVHLAAQRWYDHDEPPARVGLVDSEQWLDGDPWLWWLLVEAFDDQDRSRGWYQLVLGARAKPEQHDFLKGKETELLGAVDAGDERAAVYDATIDAELAIELLGRIAPGMSAHSVRALTVEQSNSSIVYDETIIVKLFRRMHVGRNPDVDAVARLRAGGFTHVPEQPGVLERPAPDGGDDVLHLAVARSFLTGATDGWHLALTSLRVLFADHGEAERSGGDFGPDAHRLGSITGELHLRLAEAYGTEPVDVSHWVAHFRAQLDRVREHVPAEEISRRYDRVAQIRDVGPAIRIHGDYHLGQLLRADTGWYVIDFEGEPARPVAERIAPSSPLRDVAGMLRSFHYAAEVARWERGTEDRGDAPELAEDWQDRVRSAFLDGYFATDGIDDILPDRATTDELLGAFELDKAVYEVAYEVGYRPTWVGIPLGAIRRLLA